MNKANSNSLYQELNELFSVNDTYNILLVINGLRNACLVDWHNNFEIVKPSLKTILNRYTQIKIHSEHPLVYNSYIIPCPKFTSGIELGQMFRYCYPINIPTFWDYEINHTQKKFYFVWHYVQDSIHPDEFIHFQI